MLIFITLSYVNQSYIVLGRRAATFQAKSVLIIGGTISFKVSNDTWMKPNAHAF